MNALAPFLTAILAVLIMSFGVGMILGGPDKAKKIVMWELRQLLQIGRWALKWTLRAVAEVCHWAHKKL